MGNQFIFTLKVCKSKLADLDALAVLSSVRPLSALKLKEEIQDIDGVNEVDEGITNITLGLNWGFSQKNYVYLKIHWKVEVVIFTKVSLIDHL